MEDRENDFPTRTDFGKLFLKIIYIGILLFIILSALYRIHNLPKQNTSVNTQQQVQSTTKAMEKEKGAKTEKQAQPKNLTEAVIVPLVGSPKMKIIFEHIFYAFLFFVVVLLAPLPLERMKRFKLFNFELELDANEKEMVSNLAVQQDKFNFLIYWLKEENKRVFMIKERNNQRYRDFLSEMLGEMQDHYRTEWGIHINYQIIKESEFKKSKFKYPVSVKRSVEAAKESFSGLPINKESETDVFFKNFLLHCVSEVENIYTSVEATENYVIVLSSHRYYFDEYDGQLVSGLASLSSELYRRTHLLKIVAGE